VKPRPFIYVLGVTGVEAVVLAKNYVDVISHGNELLAG
jgi:hypothetical protein